MGDETEDIRRLIRWRVRRALWRERRRIVWAAITAAGAWALARFLGWL